MELLMCGAAGLGCNLTDYDWALVNAVTAGFIIIFTVGHLCFKR